MVNESHIGKPVNRAGKRIGVLLELFDPPKVSKWPKNCGPIAKTGIQLPDGRGGQIEYTSCCIARELYP